MGVKTGAVAIIGRPNSGKSTLINSLIKEKVSIISSRPQTTRNTLSGIMNDNESQIVFFDTPGIYKADNKLGKIMVKYAEEAIERTDIIIHIVDASRKDAYGSEEQILKLLKKTNKPAILILNKTDLVKPKESILPLISQFTGDTVYEAVFPISARNGEGMDRLIPQIKELLPEGERSFPEDIYTDQTERFLVSEIIREKLFYELNEEIPYGIIVEVVSFKEKPEKNIIDISVNIYCEKKSHKAIIIGKNGAMLKKIGTEARIDIEEVLGTRIFLELWVKIKTEWRNNEKFLGDMGFKQKGQ
jgi:GTPase